MFHYAIAILFYRVNSTHNRNCVNWVHNTFSSLIVIGIARTYHKTPRPGNRHIHFCHCSILQYGYNSEALFTCNTITNLSKYVIFNVIRIKEKMDRSPILSIIHTVTIGTILNFNSGYKEHGLKNVTYEQTLILFGENYHKQWWIQDFSEAVPTPKVKVPTYYLADKENWAKRGTHVQKFYSVDQPLLWLFWLLTDCVFFVNWTFLENHINQKLLFKMEL